MKVKQIGESALIERIAKKIKVSPLVIKGIGDDAAVIKHTKYKFMVLTSDMLIEKVHFDIGTATSFQIGWKALGVNLSDIAAIGAYPKYALISLGIPPETEVQMIDGIYRGINKLANKFSIDIVGGDTNRSDKLIISVVILGEVNSKNLVTRSKAKVGDELFVTGSLGGSLNSKKHLNFVPRVKEAKILTNKFNLSSMIDISDGLCCDLYKLANSNKAGAIIYEERIPFSKGVSSLDKALYDGEDFELLFSLSKTDAKRLNKQIGKLFNTKITNIGKIVEKKYGIKLRDREGRYIKLENKGYRAF